MTKMRFAIELDEDSWVLIANCIGAAMYQANGDLKMTLAANLLVRHTLMEMGVEKVENLQAAISEAIKKNFGLKAVGRNQDTCGHCDCDGPVCCFCGGQKERPELDKMRRRE